MVYAIPAEQVIFPATTDSDNGPVAYAYAGDY